jgi:hypothetical protein
MRAGEVATLVDATYQLVGRRTAKLHELGLVYKSSKDGITRSIITSTAKQRYFDDPGDHDDL